MLVLLVNRAAEAEWATARTLASKTVNVRSFKSGWDAFAFIKKIVQIGHLISLKQRISQSHAHYGSAPVGRNERWDAHLCALDGTDPHEIGCEEAKFGRSGSSAPPKLIDTFNRTRGKPQASQVD
jgi:hypothetical protein